MDKTSTSPETILRARDMSMDLGKIAVQFARVERAPRMPDGRRETDVEHSFQLSLTATELAAHFYPDMDLGLVAQFSNVHDLVEVKTGDVWTFEISEEDRAIKEANEAKALKELKQELPPYTAGILERYEQQTEREARFVKLVDKALPQVINVLTLLGDKSSFLSDHKISSRTDLEEKLQAHIDRYEEKFPEFPEVIDMIRELNVTLVEAYFPVNGALVDSLPTAASTASTETTTTKSAATTTPATAQ